MSPSIKTQQQGARALGYGTGIAPEALELLPHAPGQAPMMENKMGFVGKSATENAVQMASIHHTPALHSYGWLGVGLLMLCAGLLWQWPSGEVTMPPPVVAKSRIMESPAKPEEPMPLVSAIKPTPQAEAAPLYPTVTLPTKAAAEDGHREMADHTGQLKVTRSHAGAAIDHDVLAGYQAYAAGDDARAEHYYQQASQTDPRNPDAWLGLGAVARRQGRSDEAVMAYKQTLALDPNNLAGQLGVLDQIGQYDPLSAESLLQTLLAEQPQAAFLHAAIGNLYATQGRWPAAQQAYFQAFHLDSKNPDYAFNLAVSLDQMGKGSLALPYYQEALKLSAQPGLVMDRESLRARIAQLRDHALDHDGSR